MNEYDTSDPFCVADTTQGRKRTKIPAQSVKLTKIKNTNGHKNNFRKVNLGSRMVVLGDKAFPLSGQFKFYRVHELGKH